MPSGNDAVPWWFDALETIPGLVALGWIRFRHRSRLSSAGAPLLPPWNISFTSFATGVLCILLSGMLAVALARGALAFFPVLTTDTTLAMIVNMGILHACFVGGAWTAAVVIRSAPDWLSDAASPPEASTAPSAPYPGSIWAAGLVTFLITIGLVYPLGRLIQWAMLWRGIKIDTQVQITTLTKADSWGAVAVFSFFAIVMAPIGEELIFRGGLFRFLRTRLPRWLALIVPATVFALLHVDWETRAGISALPSLTLLAVIFSVAYERTGKIAVPIIAHALFNLHTVTLVLLGVTG